MSLKVYIRQGDSTDPADDADITDETPFFDGNESYMDLGGRYSNGEASTGDFAVFDREPLTRLASGCLVTVTEDAAGCPYWLHRGRKRGHNQGRGKRKAYPYAQWQIHSDDCNWELTDQPFSEVWSRPAETDFQRLVALQAYTLNGTASTSPHHRDTCEIVVADDPHFCINANTVTMPARDYDIGTEPREVVEDCATTAGKDYGVVRHHSGGFPSSGLATIAATYGAEGEGPSGAITNNVVVDGGDTDRALIVFVASMDQGAGLPFSAVSYRPNTSGGSGAFDQSFTQIGSSVTIASTADDSADTKGVALQAWRLVNPTASSGATNGSVFTNGESGADVWAMSVYYMTGVNQGSPIASSASGTSAGSSASTSIAGTGLMSLGAIAYRDLWSSSATATPGAGQTADQTRGEGFESFGIMNTVLQTSHKANATAMSYSSIPTTAESTPHWPFCGTARMAVAIAGSGSASGCTHLCLQYIVPDDLTTNPSPVKISDDFADWNPDDLVAPVLEGIYPEDSATIGDPSDLFSAIILRWGTDSSNAVFVEDTGRTGANDYHAFTYDDADSVNLTQAGLRANALLAARTSEHYTHQVQLLMRAAQLHLVVEGMAIQLKSTAAWSGGGYITRRVAEVKYSPLSPEEGLRRAGTLDTLYQVTLNLDRPALKARLGLGKAQAQALTAHSAVQLPYTPPGGSPLTSTNVQDAIDELQTEIDAVTGDFLTDTGGGGDAVNTVASTGASELIDLSLGNVQDFTLTAATVTLTFSGATNGEGDSALLILRQDGSGGRLVSWPGSFVFPGGVTPTLSTAINAVDMFALFTEDGGTTVYAFPLGGSGTGVIYGTPALTLGTSNTAGSTDEAIRRDATILAFDATAPVTQAFSDAAATGSATVAARRDHKHGMPASPTVTAGQLLIADSHSTPLVFADILQNDAQDDLLYAD